jgi:hypothetical protein
MGVQRSLVVMLGEKGCNVGLLKDANGNPVDKQTGSHVFAHGPNDSTLI